MEWLTIILAFVSALLTKKNTGSTSKALMAGALVGGATYGLTHYTDWGAENLGRYDGVDALKPSAATELIPLRNRDGSAVLDANGQPVMVPGSSTLEYLSDGGVRVLDATAGVLKDWGGAGTAAVVGTTALASSSSLKKWLPLGIGALALVLVLGSGSRRAPN